MDEGTGGGDSTAGGNSEGKGAQVSGTAAGTDKGNGMGGMFLDFTKYTVKLPTR
jgi:hypothetical protein